MAQQATILQGRVFLAGKLVFNSGRSLIDCTVRNLSDSGAYLEVQSPLDIPEDFDLRIAGIGDFRQCRSEWQTANRLGVSFVRAETKNGAEQSTPVSISEQHKLHLRGELLVLRASLDEIETGVLLLDHELRAQFINRAYRKMWRLPDAKADRNPPFVALMYHGRDTRAYEISETDLDAYVADRVALVKAGDSKPIDIRLSNGEVVRYRCAVLPNGGRMVTYTCVTDIVRHADQLEHLRSAFDQVQDGIVLLDENLNATFMNRAVRMLMKLSDDKANSCPSYAELVSDARVADTYGVPRDELEAFVADRISRVHAGDPTPHDIQTSDGRFIRSRCTLLPSGARMLTYTDITDLMRNAEKLEQLATIDTLTEVYNRRQFLVLAEAEWGRFQRYHRPLSLLMIDSDHFKSINDRFGHDVGDDALVRVAKACQENKRASDIVGRIGGEEFALLLPETDLEQAHVVAERLRRRIAEQVMIGAGGEVKLSVSIGVATATLGMSGIRALMKLADQGLYEAKSSGRNRVAQAKPTTSPSKVAAE